MPKISTLANIDVTKLKGVGPQVKLRLNKLGIQSVEDLLFHLPSRYQDRTQICAISDIRLGDQTVIEGEIIGTDINFGRRRSMICVIEDATGRITLRFFHFSNAQKNNLVAGKTLRCFGEVRRGATGLELYHPEYQLLVNDAAQLEKSLTPIYPTVDGFSQQSWRKLIDQALVLAEQHPFVNLIENIPLKQQYADLAESIRYLHHPPTDANLELLRSGKHPAQQRLSLEELLAHHLGLQQQRLSVKRFQAPVIHRSAAIESTLTDNLSFSLTNAQQSAINEICEDMSRNEPMLRLLQGDVGCGKTLVAAITGLHAINQGFQIAVMAPTEILAEQLFKNLSQWYSAFNFSLTLFTGKSKGKKRQEQLEAIRNHQCQAIIGTHALFQDDVEFASLGLIIIDEQHRFGVHQRLSLRDKATQQGVHPHQLIMTATPIPRTLAMSAYSHLDTSIINELPPGRTPIDTVVMSNTQRDKIVQRVHQACLNGAQAYWVCTLVEESDLLQAEAAEATFTALSEALSDLSVGLIHGRMKPQEKQSVMDDFKQGKIHLLVATTVIEVGVDVPNASLMIIENAERLGLAQLHQLRGRVGRGDVASFCVLCYQPPLSRLGKERLRAIKENHDGFLIAEKDLEIRGPGEVLGTRQTGLLQLRIADLQRDVELLPVVHDIANELLQRYPERVEPILARWIAEAGAYLNA